MLISPIGTSPLDRDEGSVTVIPATKNPRPQRSDVQGRGFFVAGSARLTYHLQEE